MSINGILRHPFSVKPQGYSTRLSLPSKYTRIILVISVIVGMLTLGAAFTCVFYSLARKYRIKYLRHIKQLPVKMPVDNLKSDALKDLMNLKEPVSKRASCDRKGGMTCYLNTALHIIAHIPEYRSVFDKSYPIIKKPNQSAHDFTVRQRIQKLVNRILLDMLRGRGPVIGLGELIKTSHQVCLGDGNKPLTAEPNDLRLALHWMLNFVSNDNRVTLAFPQWILTGFKPHKKVEDLNLERYLKQREWPSAFMIDKEMDYSYAPPMEMVIGSHRYHLECATPGTSVHVTPLIYGGNKKYYLFDDLGNTTQTVDEAKVPQFLIKNRTYLRLIYTQITPTCHQEAGIASRDEWYLKRTR